MVNILRAQFYRLFKTKAFWSWLIVICAIPLLGFVINYVTFVNQDTFTTLEDYFQLTSTLLGEYGTGSFVMTMFTDFTNYSNDFVICALICSGVVLSKEFTNGTVRNVILSDKSRSQTYFSYLIVAFFVGIAYMFAYSVMILLTYGVAVGFAELTTAQVMTGIFTSLLLGVLAVAFSSSCTTMFLFVTHKQSSTIVFPLLICMFADFIASICFVIIIFTSADSFNIAEFTGEWIPVYNKTLYNACQIDGKTVAQIALYDVILTALFTVLGWLRFRKADMK